jgi:hypothetical protein
VESDQVIDPKVQVLPSVAHVNQPPNAVMLVVTGTGVTEQVERKRSYVVSPDEADNIARQLGATAEMVRKGRAEFSGGNGGS